MELSFKLDAFEGPLDLLLHLIDKNKVDIYDIPISDITDQYMEYIANMSEKMEIASEFMVMAATLLDIKSRMLLPKPPVTEGDEEEDPRAELVAQLLEYKMYKYISFELKDRQIDAARVFYRKPSIPDEVESYKQPVDLEQLIGDLDLGRLNDIFLQVMKRVDDRRDPIRSSFGKIKKEEVSMDQKMLELTEFCRNNKSFTFSSILEKGSSKTEVIVTFLVILEMMKAGQIVISQDDTFAEIMVESKLAQ